MKPVAKERHSKASCLLDYVRIHLIRLFWTSIYWLKLLVAYFYQFSFARERDEVAFRSIDSSLYFFSRTMIQMMMLPKDWLAVKFRAKVEEPQGAGWFSKNSEEVRLRNFRLWGSDMRVGSRCFWSVPRVGWSGDEMSACVDGCRVGYDQEDCGVCWACWGIDLDALWWSKKREMSWLLSCVVLVSLSQILIEGRAGSVAC